MHFQNGTKTESRRQCSRKEFSGRLILQQPRIMGEYGRGSFEWWGRSYALFYNNTSSDEGLQTLFCEIEAILNSRPITTLSDDHHDLEPLTPNHILLLKSSPTLPPGLFQSSDVYNRRRWRQVQYLADLFWKRWSQEYLPLLQERQRWFTAKRGLQKGDIVLVVDSSAPRGSWRIGRVTEVFPDSKGLIRTVKLKTKTGFLERPINKLCLLLEDAES